MRLVVAATVVALASSCAAPSVSRRWPVMGTFAALEVRARDASAAEAAVRGAFDDVNGTMSNWSPDSELSRANAAAYPGPADVSDANLRACLVAAFEAAARTDGAFDPTVGPLMRLYGFRPHAPRAPSDGEIVETLSRVGWKKVDLGAGASSVRFRAPGMEIDLGGIAKGCALDIAARRLEKAGGVRGALLDLGGNLLAIGRPPDGREWRIAIKDPDDPSRAGAFVTMAPAAVSTSANYENRFEAGGRWIGHLMDPRTGRTAVSDVVAATVIAPTGTESDALSTALAVAGSVEAASILDRSKGVRAVLFVHGAGGEKVLASAGLKDHLELAPAVAARVRGGISFILP